MSSALHAHARAARLLVLLACAALVAACGDDAPPAPPPGIVPAVDPGAGDPNAPEPLLAGASPHGHEHEGDEAGPPPVDVGPAEARAPDGGLIVRLSRLEEPDFGYVVVRLTEAGPELRLAWDRELTRPMTVAADAEVALQHADPPRQRLPLRAVAGKDGKAVRFAADPERAKAAAWLREEPLVRVFVLIQGEPCVTDDFHLR